MRRAEGACPGGWDAAHRGAPTSRGSQSQQARPLTASARALREETAAESALELSW